MTLSFPQAFPPDREPCVYGRFGPNAAVSKTGMGLRSIGGSNPPLSVIVKRAAIPLSNPALTAFRFGSNELVEHRLEIAGVGSHAGPAGSLGWPRADRSFVQAAPLTTERQLDFLPPFLPAACF